MESKCVRQSTLLPTAGYLLYFNMYNCTFTTMLAHLIWAPISPLYKYQNDVKHLYNYVEAGFQTSPTTQGEAHLQIGPKTRGNYLNRHINYCSNFSRRECESVCVKRPVNTGEICVFAWVSHRELKMVPSFSFLHPFLALYNACI